MANLSKQQLQNLARAVARTTDDEISCEHMIDCVGAYVECVAAGRAVPDRLRHVVEHLAICPECTEEVNALIQALRRSA